MGAVVLALLLGPEPELDSESEHRDAWEAAGWGSEDDSEGEPEPEDEEGEGEDEGGGEHQSAWDAAGWGSDAGEPESDAGGTEGPREAPESEAASLWDDEPAPANDEDKLKVGDVLAGSLRLTGSFLHFYDPLPAVVSEPELLTLAGPVPLSEVDAPLADNVPFVGVLTPGGDDALVLTVARLLVEADAGEHVHLSFNGFGEISRVPAGAGAGGNFASAGSTSSAYRTRYLNWQYWDNGSLAGQLGVDRVGLRLSFDSVNLDVGRFPITYTVASLFTINDFFAPFSATAVNRIYKPGVDAIRLSAGVTATSSIDVVGVLGYDPNSDRPSWGRSAVFTRAAIVGAGVEWAALGGKVAQRWVAGGSIQAGAGPFDLRAEFHVGIPDEEGDGHDADDRPIYGRVSGGPSVTFAWHNAAIAAEYMFASDGASSPGAYIERALSGYSDDLPYLGRHYVGLSGGFEIIPILRAGLIGLVSATDGSGLAGISVMYSVADESDLILGVFVPWGRGIQNYDPLGGTLALGSEFGLAPLSAYLEARVFF